MEISKAVLHIVAHRILNGVPLSSLSLPKYVVNLQYMINNLRCTENSPFMADQ